jgi:acetate kinase
MTRALVSLNAGSSSIKFALYRLDDAGRPVHVAGGTIEDIGTNPHLSAHADGGTLAADRRWPGGAAMTHEDLLGALLDWAVPHLGDRKIVGIGHRVVHGGGSFIGPVRIDDTVLAALDKLCALAPLQQPHNLAAIRAMARLMPQVPQVASFDTAFHRGRADETTRFALPRALSDRGLVRYGFHGLSYAWIARELAHTAPDLAAGRVLVAHLGSGASLCAMHGGKSVDTTMGFTPLDGLVMGTRCGTLDPGLVLHLILREGMTAQAVETMLYQQSGLLGVSGLSSDMRVVQASDSEAARQAVTLFVARVACAAAAQATSMGGIDTLVFTAGIGEGDAMVRAKVAERLGWLGVTIDPVANQANARVITGADSRIAVMVIPANEDQMIAIEAARCLGFSA